MWTIDGEQVIEHLAGIEDAHLALATYQAAVNAGLARSSPCGRAHV
jgi:hypothetical protein